MENKEDYSELSAAAQFREGLLDADELIEEYEEERRALHQIGRAHV